MKTHFIRKLGPPKIYVQNIAKLLFLPSLFKRRTPTADNSLPAGCHGNLPVLNLLTASVATNQHFRPCRKNYALDRKMIPTF